MSTDPSNFISDELRRHLKELSIRDIAVLVGAEPVRKRFLCYGGHDTQPSLTVNDQKGIYKCFGCGEKGDTIGLVMNAKKMDYVSACKWLMNQYNIAGYRNYYLRSFKSLFNPRPLKIARPLAAHPEEPEHYKIYEWLIQRISISDVGMRYLTEKRAFKPELVVDLEIKDLEEPNRFKTALLAHFSEDELIACGLCKKDEKGFRMTWSDHVIIFPYINENLRIVNLQARRLGPGDPKYIFLSGVSPTLYNLNILNDIDRGDKLLLCEGVPDTISALTLGFNAIGVPGANSFKPEFALTLIDYDISVVPDNDAGGDKFLQNVKKAFNNCGKSVREFRVPSGNKDLNEYLIRKNRG